MEDRLRVLYCPRGLWIDSVEGPYGSMEDRLRVRCCARGL